MSRSGENIHKRKDGRWEARLQLVDEEGVKRSRSLYGKTYREAKNKLLDARQHGYNRQKESPFFEEVAWEWLSVQSAEHKGATVLKYATIIDRHLIVTFGKIKINQITEQMIRCFLLEKKTSGNLVTGKPLSASYLKLILVVLTAILNYAAQKNYCISVKEITIGHLSSPRKEADCLNYIWQQKLEQYIRKNINENTTGIALALYAGLRLGEVCALTWNDIDFESLIDAYLYRTMCLKDMEKYDEALELLEFIENLSSQIAEIYTLRADIYNLSGRKTLAKEELEKAYAIKPELRKAFENEEGGEA